MKILLIDTIETKYRWNIVRYAYEDEIKLESYQMRYSPCNLLQCISHHYAYYKNWTTLIKFL